MQKNKSTKKNNRLFLYIIIPLLLIVIISAIINILKFLPDNDIETGNKKTIERSKTNVPDLVGQDEQTAKMMCERRVLRPQITYIHDQSVPKGIVISQSPEYDTEIHEGETVLLTVSSGSDNK